MWGVNNLTSATFMEIVQLCCCFICLNPLPRYSYFIDIILEKRDSDTEVMWLTQRSYIIDSRFHCKSANQTGDIPSAHIFTHSTLSSTMYKDYTFLTLFVVGFFSVYGWKTQEIHLTKSAKVIDQEMLTKRVEARLLPPNIQQIFPCHIVASRNHDRIKLSSDFSVCWKNSEYMWFFSLHKAVHNGAVFKLCITFKP